MAKTEVENRRLLERARGGDVNAFAEMFEGYRAILHRVAYRLVGPDACDDVVMDSYLKAWRSLPRFRGDSALRTWLCRIVNNCALDFCRKRARHDARHVTDDARENGSILERIPDQSSPSPRREAERRELGEALAAAIAALSESHRTTLLLREVDGLSYRQVAAATGVSIGTVMSRLFHARRRLRGILEKSERWEG